MSWKTINQILGMALHDPLFWQMFQHDPLVFLQSRDFELTEDEKKVLCQSGHQDLAAFCQYLIDQLGCPET
ncbi:hypothetical protein [Tengunoibacter tsumagoiensis]|uniref:Uncharacterized protein n=1 Tax=Tengunoibacter tsumagoiensis TaxID=2014871 RepID=A0A402A0Z7_9CHLR|nr:hypothetical protein [Tengunoibacter tsumagoiensis]GCE12817.1 hypothetical protein KTT_26760 [Tengunoibacter tsumagoiensis]